MMEKLMEAERSESERPTEPIESEPLSSENPSDPNKSAEAPATLDPALEAPRPNDVSWLPYIDNWIHRHPTGSAASHDCRSTRSVPWLPTDLLQGGSTP
jgi:hypothetical protein